MKGKGTLSLFHYYIYLFNSTVKGFNPPVSFRSIRLTVPPDVYIWYFRRQIYCNLQ